MQSWNVQLNLKEQTNNNKQLQDDQYSSNTVNNIALT